MDKIEAIDATQYVFDIYRDLSVSARKTRPGPPERIDGVTVGFVTMTQNAPHWGEVHPDGADSARSRYAGAERQSSSPVLMRGTVPRS